MASQGFGGSISKEEKEEFLRKKMEDMKKKSEEILRRHAEVEADKRNADMLSDMVSTKIQVNVQSQSTNVVKNVKNTSHIQKEKSSEILVSEKKASLHHPTDKQRNNRQITEDISPGERMRSSRQISEEDVKSNPTDKQRNNRQITEDVYPGERMRSSRQISEENVHPAERLWNNRQTSVSEENFPPRRKDSERRKQKFVEQEDGPPPDPVNYLADPYRDGLAPEVDRSQDSRRHRSNYGGQNFHNVKPAMQQRRNYERQHPPTPPSNSHLSMSVQMTGKERKEYENWKAERNKIDEERIARQKTSAGTWKREWDLNKTEQEEAAKRSSDKQFYKQPRWLTESGDHQEQNDKKNQGNTNFEYRFHEKGDRSVMVNEHNTLTVVKGAECHDEPTAESQHQRNQGGRKIFERKQSTPINEERNFHIRKDTSWKQNDKKESNTAKGDGWENVDSGVDGVKWDSDLSTRKDVHPLQQVNNADREWKAGARFGQRNESRAFSDNRYQKSNQNVGFHDNGYVKRQKSLNAEDTHEGNIKHDRQFSGDKSFDGWRGGRHNNSGRKYDGEWKDDGNCHKPRNDRNRKVSDGWEREESWGKTKENSQRKTSDGDDPFDNSSYDHKQKSFSTERFRGGSFKGSGGSRVYSSNERGKQHSEYRKYENTIQRSFSTSDNWQSREKEYIAETEPQNADSRRWESFDHRKGSGRSRFWDGDKNGSDQRKAYKNRGNGRNAFGMNKNSPRQEYLGKSFVNLGTDDIHKPPLGNMNKNQVSKDGWECEPDIEFQTPSVKWIENEGKDLSKGKQKSENTAVFAKTIENVSSSENEQLQKASAPGDAESLDDSWEDVTSGCESELSDQNDTQSKLQEHPFVDELAKGDSVENSMIQYNYDTSSETYPIKSSIIDDIERHAMETINIFPVSSEIPFVSSHDDSIERILEEVYNDTIKGEINKNRKLEAQEQNVSEASGISCGDEISSTDVKSTENSRCDESLLSSSLDNTISNAIDETLQSSCDVLYEGTNNDDKEDNGVDDETTVLSLDCSFNEFSSNNSLNTSDLQDSDGHLEDIITVSSTWETAVLPILDSDNSASKNKNEDGMEQDAMIPSLSSEYALDSGDKFLGSTDKMDTKDDVDDGEPLSTSTASEETSIDKLTETKDNSENDGESSSNASTTSHVKSTEANSCGSQEGSTDLSDEQNKINTNIEGIQLQKSEISHIMEDCSDQETSEVTQENNVATECCLPSGHTVLSDNTSLECSDELKEKISNDCDSERNVLAVDSARACNNIDESHIVEGFNDGSKVEVQQMLEKITEDSDGQQLPEVLSDCASASAMFETVENKMEVTEMSSLPSEHTLDTSVSSSESTRSSHETEEMEYENAEISNRVTLDPDDAVSISQLPQNVTNVDKNTLNLQTNNVQEEAVTSCEEMQQVHKPIIAQTNNDGNNQNSADSVNVCDSSVVCKTETGEVAEISHLSSECALDNDIYMCKLHENIEISNEVTVTSDSNNAQLSLDSLSTVNSQKDAQESVIGGEQSNEASTTINSDKAKEQGDFSVDSDNGGENTLQNSVSDTIDPLARTVRKASATESTTEFTEVLEVTTSIPQRIVMQDSDSSHILCKDELCLNTKENEQIPNSHNLDTRLPKDLVGE